jgi:MFS family permease
MSHTLGRQLSEELATTRTVLANGNLRRLCLALLAAETSTPAFGIALYVFAYQRGGAGAVGVVALVTMLPAAVAAPFAALIADRVRRERVVTWALLARGLLVAAAAAGVVAGAPLLAVCALASLGSVAARIVFPARIALLPTLTESERELAAANAATSTIENVGFVAGPALAGLAMALASTPIVFALAAVLSLGAAGVAARIRPAHREIRSVPSRRNVRRELVAGFESIMADRTLRLVIGLYTVVTAAFGVVIVLVVGLAVDVLGIGDGGVGALNGALGIGGVAGGAVAFALAGRVQAGTNLTAGCVLFGLSLGLIGVWPETMPALLLLAAAGGGGVGVDVAAYTLVQQTTLDDVRARVFGVLEGLAVAAAGLGSAFGGVLAESLGVRGSFLVAGAVALVCALLASRLAWRAESPAPLEGPHRGLARAESS